jgi:sporulation protein YlmC with PRC-barrel domain
MKIRNTVALKHSRLAASLTACMSLTIATPLLAAQAQERAVEHVPAQDAAAASDAKPARQCISDLRAFDGNLTKDGYWLHASDYGYGFPMYGFGYPYGAYVPAGGRLEASGYGRVRPGYDVRTLIAAANILALRGQQQACETLLTATRAIYRDYLAGVQSAKAAKADAPGWRNHLIAGALPVSAETASLRSDDLIGVDVVNSHNDNLGSVEDVLLSPKSGQIDYVVIGRGGVFGFEEKYVPVPWSAFKMAKGALLLVLDASKANMDSAPQMKEKMFAADVNFGRDNEKADDYWKTHASQ